jgi:osmoprotectant transport system ATP-binding protein
VIAWEEVTKSYDGRRAVGPVTIHAKHGERIALVGPSGCGKSTLLRVALGLVVQDEGSVTIGGVKVEPGSLAKVRLTTGYVTQDGGLFPHLTCEGNVALVARREAWSEERVRERVEALRRLVRLDADVLDRYPVEVSAGQRQRVGIMRALMLGPRVLLLDEPMGSLDPLVRADLQDELRELFAALSTTVVLITHDVAEAAIVCARIVLLRSGRVAQDGTLADLLSRPADGFVERFMKAQRGTGAVEVGR